MCHYLNTNLTKTQFFVRVSFVLGNFHPSPFFLLVFSMKFRYRDFEYCSHFFDEYRRIFCCCSGCLLEKNFSVQCVVVPHLFGFLFGSIHVTIWFDLVSTTYRQSSVPTNQIPRVHRYSFSFVLLFSTLFVKFTHRSFLSTINCGTVLNENIVKLKHV